MKKVIVFDFDDTLVKSLKYWYKTMDRLTFIECGLQPDKSFPTKRNHLGNDEIAQKFLETTGLDLTINQVKQMWFKNMEYFYSKKIKMLKGAKQYLEYLKNKGYKICIASATDLELLTKAIEIFDLKFLIDEIYTETTIGYSKRNIKFLEALLNKLNIDKDEMFYFEDSYASLSNAIKHDIDSTCIKTNFNKVYFNELKQKCKLVINNYKNKKLYQIL